MLSWPIFIKILSISLLFFATISGLPIFVVRGRRRRDCRLSDHLKM